MPTQKELSRALSRLENQTGYRVSSFTITPDGLISSVVLTERGVDSGQISQEHMTFEAVARATGVPASLYGRMVLINSGTIRYRIRGIVPREVGEEPLLQLEALKGSQQVPDIERPASQVLKILRIPHEPLVSTQAHMAA